MQQLRWFKRYNLLMFNELDSTNVEARRLVESGTDGNFVIWAESQTSGKGRYGRQWVSQPDNLYLSILLDSSEFADKQEQLSFVASLSVYNAIRMVSVNAGKKIDLGLKWPNDVLVGGAKISGILLESIQYIGACKLIIGIGINVSMHPTNLDRDTTSMHALGLDNHTVAEVLNLVMSSFENYYLLWRTKGFRYIRGLWLKKIYNPKHVMTVNDGKNRISGIFKDLDLNGAIRLKLASGHIYTLSAGEVFFDK